MIDAGRATNDYMAKYTANIFIKKLLKNISNNRIIKVLIVGVTFKENCPDIRNSKVFSLIKELKTYSLEIDVFDPIASKENVLKEYDIEMIDEPKFNYYDGLILAVPHKFFEEKGIEYLNNLCKKDKILFDLKSFFKKTDSQIRL